MRGIQRWRLPRAIYAFPEEVDEPNAAPTPESWINVVRNAGTQISGGIFVRDPSLLHPQPCGPAGR